MNLPAVATAAFFHGLVLAAGVANFGSLTWKQGILCAAAALVSLASLWPPARRFDERSGAHPAPLTAVVVLALCYVVLIAVAPVMSGSHQPSFLASAGGLTAAFAVLSAAASVLSAFFEGHRQSRPWMPREVLMVPVAACVAVAGLRVAAPDFAPGLPAPLRFWKAVLAAVLAACAVAAAVQYAGLRGAAVAALSLPCGETAGTRTLDRALDRNRVMRNHSFETALLERKAACLLETGDRNAAGAAYARLARIDPTEPRWQARLNEIVAGSLDPSCGEQRLTVKPLKTAFAVRERLKLGVECASPELHEIRYWVKIGDEEWLPLSGFVAAASFDFEPPKPGLYAFSAHVRRKGESGHKGLWAGMYQVTAQ